MIALARRLPVLLAAALVIHLVLIQPNHPRAMTWDALRLFPLELVFILPLFIALPAGHFVTRMVRILLVAVLVVLSLLKVADYALFVAFGRSFNPLVDLNLIEAGIRLLAGSIGAVLTTGIVVAGVLAPFVLAGALWWATGVWSRVEPGRVVRVLAGGIAALGLAVSVADIGDVRGAWDLPLDPSGTAFTARVALERVTAYQGLFAQLAAFRTAAADDPYAQLATPLDRLEGRDVVIVFVESYSRASFDDPFNAGVHQPTLAEGAAKLEAAGLSMRSGWVTSPIAGGQSWLAHGTLASGLTTSNQALYSAMLASDRMTLFDYATKAGYETAAVMPAITLPWPEARLLGFQSVYPARDLGYGGLPFNWVTMPDQFTLAAFDRLFSERKTPYFAQLALISSHAPWVPVPEMVDWDDVGDGSIFNAMATSGEPPSVVWQDRQRIRDQYRLAIDYSLETLLDYVARSPESGERLTIVLGDHPPTPFVAGIEGRDVPMHVIGPIDLVDAIGAWDWSEGLVPGSDASSWPMAGFRDRFLDTFTTQRSGDADG
ncbi:sulfatase-like hydrolase/transferase [Pelagibacterium luteolum]|uniref:Sulfatase N-terminal domain-containing protein n=1 Tax=Pelagibacterium luteolum TaxID=440168 RepID=A0A1G7S509_9HYPH|nr:sulfatase-like hydrolase/transferase [Pelagibacterium luteolum]SDG17559.1 hypothetical protein SAMN04487974_101281 [Pelagibacterium luteolum]